MAKRKIVTARNRAAIMCSLVALYVVAAIFFLFRVNQLTQDIYDYPYAVSSQARIMKSRLYDFRSMVPVVFSTKDLTWPQIEHALKAQESLQLESIMNIEERYRGEPEELTELKEALTNIGIKRRELVQKTRDDPSVENIIKTYHKVVEPAFIKLDDVLDRIAVKADNRGSEINEASDRIIVNTVWATLLMGCFLIWFIYRETNKATLSYKRVFQRDKLLNLLCSNVNDVFLIFNHKRDPEYVSANTLRMLGINHDAILKDKDLFFDLFTSSDRNWIRNLLSDSDLKAAPSRNVQLKNNPRTFKLSVYPIRTEELSFNVVSLFDETDQIEYQRNLGDALRNAQEASKAKSDFLSHMSHEIRTPMNAIIGMTTIALSKLNNKEKVEDCLKKTMQASRHLLGLINDILDMSKIESKKLTLNYETFDLREAIQSFANLIEPQARAKGVNFEIALKDIKYETLIGDVLRVNQILINIVSNAIKFTPAGGRVLLKIVQKVTSPEHVHLRFYVKDTGIGISPEFMKKVFEPFEQESAEIAKRFGGSGLGLAITRNLVSLMGGSICANSQEGKGTTFIVDIPFAVTLDSVDHPETLQELKALIIDDDKGTCEHASILLSQLGQKTEYALSGKEGIEKIKRSLKEDDPFDICFLDWKMPEMDGEETAKEIRKIVGPETLIIIISAYDFSSIEKRAKEIGVNGFIAKPFFTSSFYECIRNSDLRKNKHSHDEKIIVEKPKSNKRILLAEDNEFNAEVAQEFLEMAGYSVEVVANGEEAVQAFIHHVPGYYQMILMDIQMPVKDGLQATRDIRGYNREDAAHIPIVAMTANAFSDDVSMSLNAGMNDHISKPIDLKKLHQVLGKYAS